LMDQEREKLARRDPAEDLAWRIHMLYRRRENGPLHHEVGTVTKMLHQWGDLRAEQVRRDRDMEWWEAVVLVDNVAPEPAAAKQWLLNLAAYEREQVRRETVEEAMKAQCLSCLEGQPLVVDEEGFWHDLGGGVLIAAECCHLRRAFAASQGGTTR
jgi:hypothetical protein